MSASYLVFDLKSECLASTRLSTRAAIGLRDRLNREHPELIHGANRFILVSSSKGERPCPETRKNIFVWNNPRRLPTRGEVEVAVWEERDRLHIHIRDKKTQQKTIAEWWDDDARQMFEDGFFKRGRDLERSVLDYAEEMGLIARGNPAEKKEWYWFEVHVPGRAPQYIGKTETTPSEIKRLMPQSEIMPGRLVRVYGRPPVLKNIFTWNNPEEARDNIFAWNNPGKEQAWLAEQFVKGANSGVAGSMYVHGPTIYSYGPHFPIARREGDLILITTKHSPSRTTSGHIGLIKRAAQQAGKEVAYQELTPEAAGPAGYSNPLTRREAHRALMMAGGEMASASLQRSGRLAAHYRGRAYGHADSVSEFGPLDMRQDATIKRAEAALFRNPAGQGRGSLEQFSKSLGLHFETWAPGDGVTRYRFFTKPTDYHAGDGIYTALGRADAMRFIKVYGLGRGAKPNVTRRNCCNNPGKCSCAFENHVVTVVPISGGYYSIRISPAPDWAPTGQVGRYKLKSDAEKRADVYRRQLGARRNPLLQTVLLANPGGKQVQPFHPSNPPVSQTWDRLTRRQRHAALEFAGLPDDYAWVIAAASSWAGLTDGAKRALERSWEENPKQRGTGEKRPARRAGSQRPRTRVITTKTTQVKRIVGNPSIRIPFHEGQKIPIERARAWVRKLGNPELMKQFNDAERLQTKANRKPTFVIWKTLPIGSSKRVEMVTAFAHYGDSPETMYKPPKGSRKGRSLYRHDWGDGSGRPKPVPILAAPSGKAIIKVMGSGQKTGDWMRG